MVGARMFVSVYIYLFVTPTSISELYSLTTDVVKGLTSHIVLIKTAIADVAIVEVLLFTACLLQCHRSIAPPPKGTVWKNSNLVFFSAVRCHKECSETILLCCQMLEEML